MIKIVHEVNGMEEAVEFVSESRRNIFRAESIYKRGEMSVYRIGSNIRIVAHEIADGAKMPCRIIRAVEGKDVARNELSTQ